MKYKNEKKYVCSQTPFTFQTFMECAARKFDLGTMDFKVFDESKTEVDEEVFEILLQKQDLCEFEICVPQTLCPDDTLSSSANSFDGALDGLDSDDTIILLQSPSSQKKAENHRLAQIIEDALKSKPGGEKVITEYNRRKCLSDSARRDMIKILVAHMTDGHGTSPSRRVKEEYAMGIISLFPYLADPKGKNGYEHFYNAEDGSGFLAWRIKTVQKEVSEGRMKSLRESQTGGPTSERDPFKILDWLSEEGLCSEAIALMKHTPDTSVVKAKMTLTFAYRQQMLHDPQRSSQILTMFPRFLDIPGMIEQDFTLIFGDATSAKFLEKWPTVYKQKVIAQSSGLTQTCDLQDLVQNATSNAEVEEGWDSDMSSILILAHLLPPSSKGRKRPGKISVRQACDCLVKFMKTGTSIQAYLDGITESVQPYHLAVGANKSRINAYFIVIDKHVVPCSSSGALACFDELFKAHFVFGTAYNKDLANMYIFLQTTVYDIDVETTKVSPRVAELRARMLH